MLLVTSEKDTKLGALGAEGPEQTPSGISSLHCALMQFYTSTHHLPEIEVTNSIGCVCARVECGDILSLSEHYEERLRGDKTVGAFPFKMRSHQGYLNNF